jgi:phosphate/sulfate permease
MDVISQFGPTLLVLAIIFGVFMTWGIGANDVANALGTSVGSGAITVRTAIIVAAIFEFAGAALAGGSVTKTIRKGIIDPSAIADRPELLVFGMHLNIDLNGYESAAVAALIGIITALIGKRAVGRVLVNKNMDRPAHLASVERVFAPMIVFTACAMAFAHGSNDVANGIGPLAAVYGLIHSGGEVTQKLAMPR